MTQESYKSGPFVTKRPLFVTKIGDILFRHIVNLTKKSYAGLQGICKAVCSVIPYIVFYGDIVFVVNKTLAY